jgi:hypothetical protein
VRKCQACKIKYEPVRPLQTACSTPCAINLARTRQAKIARKLHLEAKRKLKTRAQWMREAQAAFNAYIRHRDVDLPCISCGDFTPMTRGGDYDCGHYRSIGANPELRFHEFNANKQCKRCNSHLSGNIANYRIGLLLKYGPEVVAEIEGPHPPQKFTIEALIETKEFYKNALKLLKAS